MLLHNHYCDHHQHHYYYSYFLHFSHTLLTSSLRIVTHTDAPTILVFLTERLLQLLFLILTVRIGRDTAAEGFGYFEDRRPASNVVRTRVDTYIIRMLLEHFF